MSEQSRYTATNEVTSTASDVKAEEARVKRSEFEFNFERNQQLSDKITFVESVDTNDGGGIICNVTVDGIPCLALVDHQDRTDTGIGLTSIFFCPEVCCSKFTDDK
ncbi:hypothetical protein V865_002853 [Kwoniella europaea PYCC6329]|uniref:Uncharacterized protein n=1 Tax=Kwoniella europaea PYCC6329 TaxID=1423913 RepID=A0AAX4KEE6_9TREE